MKHLYWFVGLTLLACAGPAQPVVAAAARDSAETDVDWPAHALDNREQRYSTLSKISERTVRRLGLLWSLDLDGETALEATPLEVRGVLYFSGSMASVYAVNATTGVLLWRYDARGSGSDPHARRRIYNVNRGVAYADGKIFVCTKDGRMIALNAMTGQPAWESEFLLTGTHSTSTGAPRAFNGIVVIGNSGAEYGGRGYLSAFDVRTGALRWRFFVVPGDPARGFEDGTQAMIAKTWSGEWWKFGGGGSPWNAITFDKELNQLYFGTGNGAPWAAKFRSDGLQDNLFVASIVALDATTGRYKWHYQTTPGDVWDYDATQDLILSDLMVGGSLIKALMQANKNGFFYVIDRRSGKLISATKFEKVTWADHVDMKTGRPAETPGARYTTSPFTLYPSSAGAHDWQAMSYSAQTGLVYIPAVQLGESIGPSRIAEAQIPSDAQRTFVNIGVDLGPAAENGDPRNGKSSLLAWDPVKRAARWRVEHQTFWDGGTLSTAGNLVFQGLSSGQFVAYAADTGRQLWSFDAGLGIIAPPITYQVNGRQFVSLLVGYGSAGSGGIGGTQGWKYGRQPRRLLTFALDAHARLPATAPADFSVTAVDDSSMVLDPALVARGNALYFKACIICHGAGMSATGDAPDLRESTTALNSTAFTKVVRAGALSANGMPAFDEFSDDEIASLYQAIRSRARESLSR